MAIDDMTPRGLVVRSVRMARETRRRARKSSDVESALYLRELAEHQMRMARHIRAAAQRLRAW